MFSGLGWFSFANPAKSSRKWLEQICSMTKIDGKLWKFPKKKFFPKFCYGEVDMAFLQSSRRLFGRTPEMNCSMFQKDVMNIFFSGRSFFIWKCSYGFYGHIEIKFESYAEKTLTKGQTCFAQCPVTIRNKKVRIFFPVWSSGHV